MYTSGSQSVVSGPPAAASPGNLLEMQILGPCYIYIGDISIGGAFFAVKRLVVAPHFDYSFTNAGGLWSAGTELSLDLNSVLTLGWPCSFGLSASYNGGNAIHSISETSDIEINRWNFTPTFNVTF